jgi:hypothetical protein
MPVIACHQFELKFTIHDCSLVFLGYVLYIGSRYNDSYFNVKSIYN